MPNSEEDAWLKDSVSGRGLATGDNIIVRLSKGQVTGRPQNLPRATKSLRLQTTRNLP